ncbi:hypothetical protein T12_3879 [Trichinella patagoniensis]|uniref:Uncharacterized protein n=1 Tax=Trichinella patagoniensis TaxID=990121 RepID=A0A0V1A666_9BILA|nr:hypothetical protein T12_3879 [Trichinella patagoniensis]
MYATANSDTKNCVLFGMYSELVCAMENKDIRSLWRNELSTVGGKSFPTRHLLIEFSMRRLLIRMTEHLVNACASIALLSETFYFIIISSFKVRIQNCVILIVQLQRAVGNLYNTVVKLVTSLFGVDCYPAILIRLTRSTAAAAYDGKVTFKLDKLTEATKVLTFGWLFSPTNPFDSYTVNSDDKSEPFEASAYKFYSMLE